MPDPQKRDGEGDPEVTAESLAKMQGQIDNLNEGIASYRSQLKDIGTKYEDSQTEIESLKSKLDQNLDEDDDDKELTLNPTDEKKLEAWGRQKGFVSKEEFAAERQKIQFETIKSYESQAVSEFLGKHPEYDKDEEWTKVLSEFNLYRQPTSLDSYKKLLERVHNDLSGGTDKAREEGRTIEKIENDRKGRLSLGGGRQAPSGDGAKDLENLQKRYPSLSRDQIQERISDIDSLYPKK